MHPDKAPVPDGYNGFFFQKNWELIGDEVTKAIQIFFSARKMLKEINPSFVTLNPKSLSPSSLSDFRPISCCNLLYKLITKVQSNRLKLVINELISESQCAFIPGIMISDSSFLAHELVRDFINPMGSRLCLKVV